MRCQEARQWIEEYHDGELETALREEVEAHVRDCPECLRQVAMLRAEDDLYRTYAAGLDQAMSGESALWGRINARIRTAAGSAPGWMEALRAAMTPRRLAVALVLVVISVAGTLVTVRMLGDRAPLVPAESVTGGDLEMALRSIENAEREYLEAIRLLSNIVEKRKPTLEPQLLAELERSLKDIDENIAATRRAFRDHPSDPEYALYMLAAYAKKVELLQEIAS